MTPPQRICEVAHAIQKPGGSGIQAQIALGRIVPTEPIRLTVLLPNNVTLQTRPKVIAEEREGTTLELTWMRCLPTGCFANAVTENDVLQKLRAQTTAGRLVYQDGAGRDIVLPVSVQGLSEALDAYARESVEAKPPH